MQERALYQYKETQSATGMLRYRTEIQDAGMRMPASIPMPSYAIQTPYKPFTDQQNVKTRASRFRICREVIFTYPKI
jgi:hypothetical protein